MSRGPSLIRSLLKTTRRPLPCQAGPSRRPSPGTSSCREFTTSSTLSEARSNTPLRDADIPFPLVQLVSPVDNSISAPQPLRNLLRTYDHTTHFLQLVSSDPPVVKLLDKVEEYRKTRESEAKATLRKRTAAEEKEVQISWASASGDVAHKIDQARTIIERGDRVRLVFAPRASGPNRDKISEAKKTEMVKEFEGALGEVGKKWKENEAKGKVMACFWEPEGTVREEVKAKVIEDEAGKKKERDERKESRRRKDEERRRQAEEKRVQGLGEEAGPTGPR